MGLVHRDHVVEPIEVTLVPVLGAALEAIATCLGGADRARIGAFAHVPTADAEALDVKGVREPSVGDELLEDPLGGGRATDVPGAHEAHADLLLAHAPVRYPRRRFLAEPSQPADVSDVEGSLATAWLRAER